MINLSIIIVSYNTKDILIECIKSIISFTNKISYEIIVVDNASTDKTIEKIQFCNAESKLKIISNEKNLGFSKANNLGVKQAEGEYILFLNSDTLVRPQTLEVMVNFMKEHQDVGAATCRVELPEGKLDDACHRGFPTPWNSFCYFVGLSKFFPSIKIFNGYGLGDKDFSRTHQIDACCGAFMIVRKEAGEQIGWWDEDYFWYGEDLDFCYRLKQKGWKVHFVASCSILHYKGVSGGIKNISKHLSIADEKTKKLAQKARFEAMRIFYKKHYQKKYPQLVGKLMDLGISIKEKLSS